MTTPSRYKHFNHFLKSFPLFPGPEHSILNVLQHILHGQLRINFGCFYRGIPHHDLQHLFGYFLPESHRAGKHLASNVCG